VKRTVPGGELAQAPPFVGALGLGSLVAGYLGKMTMGVRRVDG
jgi:hypothetical protein